MKTLSLALTAVFATGLVACTDEASVENTDLDVATTDGEAAAKAREIQGGDLADLQLGAKIVGPQGEEVKARLTNEAGAFADITSYVACPKGVTECDPATAPNGMIYTYVHTVYPGEDNQDDSGSGTGADSSDVEIATSFMMTQPAYGFTGAVGYSTAEVIRAVGNKAQVVITCLDGGIVWTINAGGGGDQWEQAEPITFWWQSTVPPAGPADAYAIKANYVTATGNGPYPAKSDQAPNACTAPSTDG